MTKLEKTVGIIGLGAIGLGMAANMATAGVRVVVLSTNSKARSFARDKENVQVVETIAELTHLCDIILTCLPDIEAAEGVFFSDEGIFANAQLGLITCDSSTVGPEFALRQHAKAGSLGIQHVEAPVFGTRNEADAGELVFVVSGDEEAIGCLSNLFRIMGRAHLEVSGKGKANTIKVIQNGLGLVQVVAIAEAMDLCSAAGIDRRDFTRVVIEGRGMAATPLFKALSSIFSGQSNDDPKWQNYIAVKDIGLACDLAVDRNLHPALINTANLVLKNSLREPGLNSVLKSVQSLSRLSIPNIRQK